MNSVIDIFEHTSHGAAKAKQGLAINKHAPSGL
jgi:hypothetical protein